MAQMDEHTARSVWIGWGATLVSIGAAYFTGGVFWAYVCVFGGMAIALRGHFPTWFTGIQSRVSVKAWAATLVTVFALAGIASIAHRKVAPEKPDLAKVILDGVRNLLEQRQPPTPNPSPAPLPVLTPTPARPPSGLRVLRYETLPYQVGEPLKVRMFIDNGGSSSITLFGGSHSRFVDKLPRDFDERRQLEKTLWGETAQYIILKDRPLKFQALPVFADLMSEDILSQDKIDSLAKGSVIYLMTVLKDQRGKVAIESCIHTDPAGNNLFFCADHNSP